MLDTYEHCAATLYPDDERVSHDGFCYHFECAEELGIDDSEAIRKGFESGLVKKGGE